MLVGALAGCAIGDAIGLHREGLSARRATRMFPNPDRYYFLGKWGTTSDDYDHAFMTAEALCAAGNDVDIFARELAKRIKVWAACIPGGIGLATLKSAIKLWCGVSPQRSGVFSAGNGPAMRSHILGAFFDDIPTLVDFVRASTVLSHTDPKAFTGALVIAIASRHSARAPQVNAHLFLGEVTDAISTSGADTQFVEKVREVIASVNKGETTESFMHQSGCKGYVSGYIYHTVPATLHAWLSFPNDLPRALKAVIQCGGDCDTMGSILGGIIGTRAGLAGIPKEWLDNLILWPREMDRAKMIAEALAESRQSDVRVSPWKHLVRNLWFDAVVLLHGLRRLAPPY